MYTVHLSDMLCQEQFAYVRNYQSRASMSKLMKKVPKDVLRITHLFITPYEHSESSYVMHRPISLQ